MALLVSNFFMVTVDIPILLSYYISGKMVPQTDRFCQVWLFIDYYLFVTGLMLMTFASFERHILILHSSVIHAHSKRILLHYAPLLLCGIYPFCYYIGVLFIYPCANYYDYTIQSCLTPCYLMSNQIVALYEFLAHGTVPTFLIALFSIGLWMRVLMHNQRVRQTVNWGRHRKLTMQMLGISCLYLITNMPLCIVNLIQLLGMSDFGLAYVPYFVMVVYFNPTILPFVCLGCLPDLRKKLNWRARTRRVDIAPAVDNRRS